MQPVLTGYPKLSPLTREQTRSALPAYLRVPPYSLQDSLHLKFSAFFAYPSSSANFHSLLTFGPSAGIHDCQPNMASADFWQFSRSLLHGLPSRISSPRRTCQTSPGKSDSLHPMHPPHLLYGVWAVSDFVLLCKLVRPTSASYAVLVHQVGTLPSASFRFHLTVDTLAFG